MNRFNEIVFDLGELLEMPLHVDENNACQMIFDEEIAVTLEMDDADQVLFLVAPIVELPPGKFRVGTLFEALRANSIFPPVGYLTFLSDLMTLVLCDALEEERLEGEACLARIVAIKERAALWKKALDAGQMAPQEALQRGTGAPSAMFGLER